MWEHDNCSRAIQEQKLGADEAGASLACRCRGICCKELDLQKNHHEACQTFHLPQVSNISGYISDGSSPARIAPLLSLLTVLVEHGVRQSGVTSRWSTLSLSVHSSASHHDPDQLPPIPRHPRTTQC